MVKRLIILLFILLLTTSVLADKVFTTVNLSLGQLTKKTSTNSCKVNWTCGNWGSCENNNQTRFCNDTAKCYPYQRIEYQTCNSIPITEETPTTIIIPENKTEELPTTKEQIENVIIQQKDKNSRSSLYPFFLLTVGILLAVLMLRRYFKTNACEVEEDNGSGKTS